MLHVLTVIYVSGVVLTLLGFMLLPYFMIKDPQRMKRIASESNSLDILQDIEEKPQRWLLTGITVSMLWFLVLPALALLSNKYR